jgi:hypothetical protein
MRGREIDMERLGVVIVGINGAVASTMIAGVELMAHSAHGLEQ